MSPGDGARASWLAWLLPFLVCPGLAAGALVGLSSASDAARREGPAGDVAGAADALLVVICVVVGFVVSLATMVGAKLLRRGAPGRHGLRLLAVLLGGAAVGALAASSWGGATPAAWALLAAVPAAASWTWRAAGGGRRDPLALLSGPDVGTENADGRARGHLARPASGASPAPGGGSWRGRRSAARRRAPTGALGRLGGGGLGRS